MDTLNVIVRILEVLPRFMPPPKAPKIDYDVLRTQFPTYSFAPTPGIRPLVTEVNPAPSMAVVPRQEVRPVATSCMACSRSHLSTVTGALNESLRFARDEGITSPEVQRRLGAAEDEINIMERIDLSAEAIQNSPADEQEMARAFLPRIRKIRQDLGQISSVEDLEKTAAESSVLTQEFRLGMLQAKGVDLNPVLALAKRVQAGEISMEAAKEELKKILPEE